MGTSLRKLRLVSVAKPNLCLGPRKPKAARRTRRVNRTDLATRCPLLLRSSNEPERRTNMKIKTARRLTRASHLDVVVGPSTAEASARRRPTSGQNPSGAGKNRKDPDLTKPPIQSQGAKSANRRQETIEISFASRQLVTSSRS